MKQQGHLNVNLLKNKMEALAELIEKIWTQVWS